MDSGPAFFSAGPLTWQPKPNTMPADGSHGKQPLAQGRPARRLLVRPSHKRQAAEGRVGRLNIQLPSRSGCVATRTSNRRQEASGEDSVVGIREACETELDGARRDPNHRHSRIDCSTYSSIDSMLNEGAPRARCVTSTQDDKTAPISDECNRF